MRSIVYLAMTLLVIALSAEVRGSSLSARFLEWHSATGNVTDLSRSQRLEDFAVDLIEQYKSSAIQAALKDNREFEDDLVFRWVAIVVNDTSHFDAARIEKAFKGGDKSNEATRILYVLMDRLKLYETLVAQWKKEPIETQFWVMKRIFSKNCDYSAFANQLRQGVKVGQLYISISSDAIGQEDLEYNLKWMLLKSMGDSCQNAEIPSSVFQTPSAKLLYAALKRDLTQPQVQEFIEDIPRLANTGCASWWVFAKDREIAQALYSHNKFLSCSEYSVDLMTTVAGEHPDIFMQFVEQQKSQSINQQDLARICRFHFDHKELQTTFDQNWIDDQIAKSLLSVPESLWAGFQYFPIAYRCFEIGEHGTIQIRPDMDRRFKEVQNDGLQKLKVEMEVKCPHLLFGATLEEAVLSINSNVTIAK